MAPAANTQSQEVNLTKRVLTSTGMRYCPVVLSPNGRVKPDLVIVNGRPERHSEGAYYLGVNKAGECAYPWARTLRTPPAQRIDISTGSFKEPPLLLSNKQWALSG